MFGRFARLQAGPQSLRDPHPPVPAHINHRFLKGPDQFKSASPEELITVSSAHRKGGDMGRLIQVATAALILVVLTVFSYFYLKRSPMPALAGVITLTIILLVPLISLSYVCFRLAAREAQLKDLFKRRGILIAYLTSKGVPIKSDEPNDADLKDLRLEFDKIFETEMTSEYGRTRYLSAILISSVVTGVATYYLATSSFGGFLIGTPNALPTPVQVGLMGAFAWNLWLLLSSYDTLDQIPSTFYWMAFRYVVAIVAGSIAGQIPKYNGTASVFALTATVIPYPRLLEFLRSKIPTLKKDHAGEPSIWKIQGMPQSTIDRLATLGIYTTQELAYSDPLMLLFRTNFQPKVVIDWIDQCLLYNYVGESLGEDIKHLRVRGIRGSIEMSGLKDDDPALEPVAATLKIDPPELKYFRDKLLNDYQVKLISKLWDEFKPASSSISRAAAVAQQETAQGLAIGSGNQAALSGVVKPVVEPAKAEVVTSIAKAQAGVDQTVQQPVTADTVKPAAGNGEPVKPVPEPTNGERTK